MPPAAWALSPCWMFWKDSGSISWLTAQFMPVAHWAWRRQSWVVSVVEEGSCFSIVWTPVHRSTSTWWNPNFYLQPSPDQKGVRSSLIHPYPYSYLQNHSCPLTPAALGWSQSGVWGYHSPWCGRFVHNLTSFHKGICSDWPGAASPAQT